MPFLGTGVAWLVTGQGRRGLVNQSYGPYSPHFIRKTPDWGLIKCSPEAWGIHRRNSSVKASEGSVRAGLCLGHWQISQDMRRKKTQAPWRLWMENTEESNIRHPGALLSAHTDENPGNAGGVPRALTLHSHCTCGGALSCASQNQNHQPLWNMQNLPEVSVSTSLRGPSETDSPNKAACALFAHDPQIKITAHQLKWSILSSAYRSDRTNRLSCLVHTGWMGWDGMLIACKVGRMLALHSLSWAPHILRGSPGKESWWMSTNLAP